MRLEKEEINNRLEKEIKKGRAIIGAGTGTGISAKFAEAGGVDIISVYNSGRYRMGGQSSLTGLLPYGDANEIVVDMSREILPIVEDTPVLAGVCGTDPFRSMDVFLRRLKDIGFSGVQNFPTVGLIDGKLRQNLEETGISYDKEIKMIEQASRLGLFTSPYVFDEEEAKEMTKAGADLLIAHLGLTTSGSVGAKTAPNLEESAHKVQAICDAGKEIREEVKVIFHGGPAAEPEDVEYILQNTEGVAGYFGASSIERLPTEEAIKEQALKFKKLEV